MVKGGDWDDQNWHDKEWLAVTQISRVNLGTVHKQRLSLFWFVHFCHHCSPDDNLRRYRRDHTPEEEQHQEELQEEQEEEKQYEHQYQDQEDKEEQESCIVEASLPDLLPASWQQSVLLPDLLDLGSDAPDGGGCRENSGSTESTGRVKNVNKRVF